ncbi:MAG: DNA-binding MarR family transcriptional regulator [Paracoccaceae bacterium]|jgi:DNA-binding MarR family transcriptional regulator
MPTNPPALAATPAAPRADAALRSFVGYNIKRVYIAIQADFLVTLDEFSLRATTFSALTLIVAQPDMTQSQLAAALSIERSGVVLIVDELESRDLISRNKVPRDRRTYALRATLAGVQMRDKAVERVQAHEHRMLAHLSNTEREELMRMLSLIEGTIGAAP